MQHFVFNISSTIVINWRHSNASLLANQTVKSLAAHHFMSTEKCNNAILSIKLVHYRYVVISFIILSRRYLKLKCNYRLYTDILCFNLYPSDNRQKINDNAIR